MHDPPQPARRARWLSIEPRYDGLAVQAPYFYYVWDPVDGSALAWTADLHAAAADPDERRRGRR